MTSPSRIIREKLLLPPGKLGRSDSHEEEVIVQNFGINCQFRSKLAITHTITIKWKEKYDAVVVDCHHSLCLCDDRMKMSPPKKNIFFFYRETPTTSRQNFGS